MLLFPQPRAGSEDRVRPLVMRPGAPLEPLDVPAAPAAPCDAIAFGDDSLLVIWNSVPYHWDGESPPISLGGELLPPEDLCGATTLADGSIAGAFGRRLMRIDRDGRREVLLQLDTIVAVTRGADDALIIAESESPENDVLKIWWPRTRDITCIDARTLKPRRPAHVLLLRRDRRAPGRCEAGSLACDGMAGAGEARSYQRSGATGAARRTCRGTVNAESPLHIRAQRSLNNSPRGDMA